VERLNITLDAEQGAKLARLADRMHVQLARSLAARRTHGREYRPPTTTGSPERST
jgi:hypothetical protein